MLFKRVLFKHVFLPVFLSCLLALSAHAAQQNVAGNMLLPSGGTYDSNSGVGTTDKFGLYMYSPGASNAAPINSVPYIINTGGDISAQYNQQNGVYSKFGLMGIEGAPGANSTLNASYTGSPGNGDGIYAEDTTTSGDQSDTAITIKNMNVIANNNGQSGIFAANAGKISIYGSDLITNKLTANNNLYGVISQFTGSLVDIRNVDIEIKNNSFFGIVSLKGVSDIEISGRPGVHNTMVLENNGYGLAVFNHDAFIPGISKFDISQMDIFVKNNKFALIQDGTSMKFDNSNIYILDNSRGLEISTEGTAILNNTNFYTDHNLFYTGQVGHSQLQATNSLLHGSIETVSVAGNSSTIDFVNTRWNMLHDSNMTNLKLENSVVDIRSQTTNNFTTLTATNYISTGSNIIHLNTVLGGDTSPTDTIVIGANGTVTGNVPLYIHDTLDMSAQTVEGIRIVEAKAGAITAGHSFSLVGGVLDKGIYEYGLYRGDFSNLDQHSWFLRSTGKLTDTARTIINVPAISQEIAKSGMDFVNQRMRELRLALHENNGGLWARTYTKHSKIDDRITTTMNHYAFEAGLDAKLDLDTNGGLHVGAMVGYATVSDIGTKRGSAARDASGDGYAPSLGVYAIWVGSDGWYADATVRNFWSKLDMTNYTSTGEPITYKTDRSILMGSVEVGRKLGYTLDNKTSVTIEPKFKIIAGRGDSDRFATSAGYDIEYGQTDFFETKLAIDTGYKKQLRGGAVIEPYFRLGVFNEWRAKTDINMAFVKQKSDLSGFGFEVGGGANIQLKNNTSMYLNAMYEDSGAIKSFGGNLGLRYAF